MQDSGNYSNRGCKIVNSLNGQPTKKPKTKTNKKRERETLGNVKSNIPLPCEALLSYGLRAADVINRSSFPHVKNTSGSGCWGIRKSFRP